MEEPQADHELFELAIHRELQANQFYLALAEYVENPQTRQILEELAEEELEHKARIELEVMKTGRVVEQPRQPEDRHIFDSLIDAPTLELDYKSVFEMAIEKEDASFRLYVDLLRHAKDNDSREVLLALAQEELKHKFRLQNIYENLPKQ